MVITHIDSGEHEALGGIDGYRDGVYCTEIAYELADEILNRVKVV